MKNEKIEKMKKGRHGAEEIAALAVVTRAPYDAVGYPPMTPIILATAALV